MTKRILFLAACLWTLSAAAQSGVGDWRIHSSFVGDKVTAVAEGKTWVYYLSGTNLFRFDKQTEENEALSKVNQLSDMIISNVFYNSDEDYLVVVYENSNIDIILSDGRVVNMPEIKDAVLTSSKKINDVTFAPGLIYLATAFGYVVIDDVRFVVKESRLYGESLTSVAQVGDVLLLTSTNKFYYGEANGYHERLSSFNVGDGKANSRLRPINDESFYSITGNTYRSELTVKPDGTISFDPKPVVDGPATQVQSTRGGFLLNVPSTQKCYKTDENGLNPEPMETGGEICSAHPDGDEETIWAGGPQGLHMYGSDSYYVPNALTMALPFWMSYNKERDLLYVSSPATNAFFKEENPHYTTQATRVNTFDGIKWTDVTPEGAPVSGSYWIEFMPGDPDTYLLGTWRKGLLKVEDNEIAYVYDNENSPMIKTYSMHPVTTIDRNGNVWVVQSLSNEEHPVMMLPAAKAKLGQVTANDWVTPTINGAYTGKSKRASFLSTRNGNYDIKVFTDGEYQKPLFIWNSGGENTAHPQQVKLDKLTDQDGQTVSWTYIMCLSEDLNGNVWMGSTEGICMFNPAAAFSGSAFTVVRPKVPREDGTGMADRLMDGIQVNDVAVDGANRKWIATQSSGLFLVNSDGSSIIQKFNTTNSPLASNTIYKVCCNPNSNSVFVTTAAGLYEYFSDSSPAQPTYEDIYAYPNPVRPDFTGEVTIMGLMDNSLVKIADASGKVIKQLKSTGGMATWDCCDSQGNSVKTGVYIVLCSQANGSGQAAVTKIAVIR